VSTVVAASLAVAVAGGNTTVAAVLGNYLTQDRYTGMPGAVGVMVDRMTVGNINVSVSRGHNSTVHLSTAVFRAIVGAEGVAGGDRER